MVEIVDDGDKMSEKGAFEAQFLVSYVTKECNEISSSCSWVELEIGIPSWWLGDIGIEVEETYWLFSKRRGLIARVEGLGRDPTERRVLLTDPSGRK